MAVLGAQTSVPSLGFAFTRAYIKRLTFGFGANAIFSQSGGNFFITDGNNTAVHVVCNFQTNFWEWSSNSYTLSWIVKDWWILNDPSPTPIPLGFHLNYQMKPGTLEPELFLFLDGWTERYERPFPQQDEPYWFPP